MTIVPVQTRYTLYQYEACPFCWKVRAVMAYKGVPYDTVEVHPLNKKELAFSKDYRKVPILVKPEGGQVNDSTEIIRQLDELYPERPVMDRGEEWLEWADETLVRAIPPLIYRGMRSSLQAFKYISKVSKFSWIQQKVIQYSGALVMTMIASKTAKSRGIKDPEAHMRECIVQWQQAIGPGPFVGGETPCAADLAAYGYLRAIVSLPAFALVAENHRVLAWYHEVQQACRTL